MKFIYDGEDGQEEIEYNIDKDKLKKNIEETLLSEKKYQDFGSMTEEDYNEMFERLQNKIEIFIEGA